MFGRQEPFLEQNQTHCQGTPQGHICQALSLRQIENNLTRKSKNVRRDAVKELENALEEVIITPDDTEKSTSQARSQL